MKRFARTVGIGLLASFLFTSPLFAQNGNAFGHDKNTPSGNAVGRGDRVAAPELNSAAAGMIGLLIVGGIALMTTRRTPRERELSGNG